MPDDRTCERWLRVIGNFVAPWPGRKVGAFNHITIANEAGGKPPLLWVFNSANEFPALAEALGPDQPLIGMRSLNGVVRIDSLTLWDSRALAPYYSDELASCLGDRPCFVGGNCQGAAIAGEVARKLILGGADVRGFIAMEWVEVPTLPVRATLLFGAESRHHNPFLRNIDPWPVWKRLYAHPDCRILPGAHGTYFGPETVVRLAEEIRRAVFLPPALPASGRSALVTGELPQSVVAGCTFTISVEVAGLKPGDDVLAIWECDSAVLPHLEAVQIVDTLAEGQTLELSAPATVGGWTLQLFLTNPQHGPQTWRADTLSSHRIDVEDSPGAAECREALNGTLES